MDNPPLSAALLTVFNVAIPQSIFLSSLDGIFMVNIFNRFLLCYTYKKEAETFGG